MRFPDNADGHALQRLVDDGANLDRPMVVDFHIVVPKEADTSLLSNRFKSEGYKVRIGDEGDQWLIECTMEMMVSYQSMIQRQSDLSAAVKPFGGVVDGWGSFGNA